ncbi:hypothetical protein CIT292_06734 [Citrobacter youngae ATCC 29220]|uniref:Uncharacterized protein n=1 Tax=Citrobacter youngae ATCC 29220 TaxID=500640 RepID=D4B697_9ENTR|nr:hypothetical protein CIT292_06734 [Citrobacter youngae ATCC 29220]
MSQFKSPVNKEVKLPAISTQIKLVLQIVYDLSIVENDREVTKYV